MLHSKYAQKTRDILKLRITFYQLMVIVLKILSVFALIFL